MNATLATVYYDEPYQVGKKAFRNWYGRFYGYCNIREAIAYSMNIVAVRCLMETVRPQLGVEYAKNFGITSLTDTDLNAATALGGITKGVSNLELTAAYASIANNGVYTKPIFFTKILDHNGKILIDNEPETHRVLKDSTAFLLTDAMADSMESNRKFSRSGVSVNATSMAANIPGMSNAGKSGTTTKNVDIWFVGYTPYYTAGVWAGCDNNQKLGGINGNTSFHKGIWRKIMTRVHENLPDPGFEVPDSIETAEICRKSGKLAIPGVCSSDPRGNASYTEYFAKGTVPTEMCDIHVRVTLCSSTGLLPGTWCPRASLIRIALPSETEGSTDDSPFGMPGRYCPGHEAAIISPTEENNDQPPESVENNEPKPIGPGYVSPGAGYSGPGISNGPGRD